jgi:hypothetical protein
VLIGRGNVVARAVITEVVLVHSEQLRKLAPILTSQGEAAAHWFHYSLSSGTGLAAHILWVLISAQLNELRMAKMIDFCSSSSVCATNSGLSQRHCAIFSQCLLSRCGKFVPPACGHDAPASGHLDVHEPAAGSASCCERQRSTVSMSKH